MYIYIYTYIKSRANSVGGIPTGPTQTGPIWGGMEAIATGDIRIYYTILYCTVLYCTILYCTVVYYTIVYYAIQYGTIIYYIIHCNTP